MTTTLKMKPERVAELLASAPESVKAEALRRYPYAAQLRSAFIFGAMTGRVPAGVIMSGYDAALAGVKARGDTAAVPAA